MAGPRPTPVASCQATRAAPITPLKWLVRPAGRVEQILDGSAEVEFDGGRPVLPRVAEVLVVVPEVGEVQPEGAVALHREHAVRLVQIGALAERGEFH